jgi:adenine phosphoribosyltransferase
MELRDHIRDIPDFPKPGIVFKDLTPLFLDPAALDYAVSELAARARPLQVELIVAAEARGFILGGALARELGVGFGPARQYLIHI